MRNWAIFVVLGASPGLIGCSGDDGTGTSTDTDPTAGNTTGGSSGTTTPNPTSSGTSTDGGPSVGTDTTGSSGTGSSGTGSSGTGSSGTTTTGTSTGSSSGGPTGGVEPPDCNFDGTCDADETSPGCPADCPWPNQPAWCDLLQTGCGFFEQTPGVAHNNVCTEWVVAKYTSNPTVTVEQRAYAIRVPAQYDGTADTPVYLWLHGTSLADDATAVDAHIAMLDTAGATASPDDTNAIWVMPLSHDPWNGAEWSFAYQTLQNVACIYNSDPEKLYVAGYQAGGSAALRIGYDPQVGVPNIAAIAAWRVGNSINDIGGLFFDPCTQARQVPTFLSASSNADTSRLTVQGWNTYLEGCYTSGRVTYQPFVGGVVPQWDPAHYGQIEWPWLAGWSLSD